MNQGRTLALAAGLLLILFGAFLLVVQWVPGLQRWFEPDYWWPLIIVAVGAFLLLLGLLTRVPPLAVPACIVGGIGLLLFWQNATGNWDSWAYAWALIPGFVGVGVLLMGLMGGTLRQTLGGGVVLLIVSAVLFAIFGTFLGGLTLLGTYWPALLIALGVVLLLSNFVRWRR